MNEFADVVTDAIVAASAPQPSHEDIQHACGEVCRQMTGVPISELNHQLGRLTDAIEQAEYSPIAALLSICCGAMIEAGADPLIPFPVCLQSMISVLRGANDFMEACYRMCEDQETAISAGQKFRDSFENGIQEDENLDEQDVVALYGEQIGETEPWLANDYSAFEPLSMGLIAMLSRSKQARQMARENPELLELSRRFDLISQQGQISFLTSILSVLDDQPLLVLHPELKKGFLLHISGIATNFELFILLEDALIGDPNSGWLAGTKPNRRAVEATRTRSADFAKGTTVTGNFNYCNWTGLNKEGNIENNIPEDDTQHWVWMEGIPQDITAWDDLRILLLTKPPYQRFFQPGRCFEGMTPELILDHQLSKEEVEGWLKKIAERR